MGLLDDPGDGSTATGTAPANGPGAAFVAAGKLGYTAFPSVPGGKGNLADLAGNTENYYSVLKNTRYPEAVADFLKVMYSPAFVKKELALGNLTTTKNTPSLISGATAPVPEVAVPAGQQGPGLPAVVGPGVAADGLEHDPHCGGELLRQPQRSRSSSRRCRDCSLRRSRRLRKSNNMTIARAKNVGWPRARARAA